MIALILLAVGSVPVSDGYVEDRVDIIELNTYPGYSMQPTDQWVFWDWEAATGRHAVAAYRLRKDQRLTRDRRGYVLEWTEEKVIEFADPCQPGSETITETIRRRVIAPQFKRTVGEDAEHADQDFLPVMLRRQLTGDDAQPVLY